MYRKVVKRLLDIILSFIALVVLFPLLLPVKLILLLTGEHYIFYGQKRVGFKNKPFKIWKFATMLKASPSLGAGSITLRNDPRVFPFGRILRKSKINELPRLFNILIGDMSIIGLRPLMKVDFDKYSKEIQDKIYNVRPGLTGIASIIFADEEKFHSDTEIYPHKFDRLYIAPYKGALELWYQRKCNFYTDMIIVFLTVVMVFNAESKLPFRFFLDLPQMKEFIHQKK